MLGVSQIVEGIILTGVVASVFLEVGFERGRTKTCASSGWSGGHRSRVWAVGGVIMGVLG